MREKIYVGKPYIVKMENRVRLCAEITEEEKKVLFYEVDEQFAKYLLIERADTFVLGLLHHAMNVGKDIVCEIGITEQLLFQLKNYYIPIISSNMPDLDLIDIIAENIKTPLNNNGAVVTGNSGGVDSFYTIVKYTDKKNNNHKLTHLLFNNISTEDYDEHRIRAVFEKDRVEKDIIAKEFNLIPINVFSNLFTFYNSHFIYNYYYTAQYVSVVYAMSKLFSIYYFSSGDTLSQFSIEHDKIDDGSDFDLFSLFCFSTSNLALYPAGIEADRDKKMKYIVDNKSVRKHLQVCAQEQYVGFYKDNVDNKLETLNCGSCRKCMRTISMLYGYGILDEYKLIFNLSSFYQNKAKFIGYEMATDHKSFTREIYKNLKEKDLMPRYAIAWMVLWKMRYKITSLKYVRKLIDWLKREK